MDDKTSPLPPSTAFDTAHTPSPHRHIDELTSSSSPALFSTNFNINRTSIMTARPQFDAMGSLMSPPENTPYDSFSRDSPIPTIAPQSKHTESKSVNLLLSPPVSPETKNTGPDTSVTVKDPILYPNQDQTSSQPPLFVDDDIAAAQRLVDEHIRQRQETVVSPPQRDDYVLALEFKSQVAKMFNADRRGWHSRERQYLLDAQKIRANAGRPYFPTIRPMPAQLALAEKIPRTPKIPREKVQGDKIQKVKVRKQSRNFSVTPEPKNHRNTPLTTTREDRDFNALPDYCPPLSSLPARPNSLKVEWKGAPIDLRNDPHRHLLHDDELALAANLRLDCATYLTSKRRIFMARIDKLKVGKEFRKTDSQQACKIDVNKASKLWTAFEKVGWLRPEWVLKYVNQAH